MDKDLTNSGLWSCIRKEFSKNVRFYWNTYIHLEMRCILSFQLLAKRNQYLFRTINRKARGKQVLTKGEEEETRGTTARQRAPADRTADATDRLEAPSIFTTAAETQMDMQTELVVINGG